MMSIIPDQVLCQEDNWVFKRKKKDIEVYTRPGENSDLKEIKIVLDIKSSLASLMTILWDVEEYPEWVPNCKKAFIIEQIDTYNVYYYAASTFPWPLQNRDLVAHSVFDQDPITKEITILTEAVEGHHPAQKGLIRIEVLQAIWILTPKPDGVVTITYFLKTDPAGNIPAWMTNKFMDRGPIQTMEKLRDMAKLEKYKNVKMSIIEEAESPSR